MIQIDKKVPLDRAEVIDLVHTCIERMMLTIEEEVNRNTCVYLIALSRKMPRLIRRVFRDLSSATREKYETILKSCVYTTEHSIPIIFPDIVDAGSRVMILDDIIISGTTLSAVAKDVNYFAGVKASAMALFVYDQAFWPDGVASVDVLSKKALSMKDCRTYLSIISSYIAEKELPIDLEYPILHIRGIGGKEEFKSELLRYYADYPLYELPQGDNIQHSYAKSENPIGESLNVVLRSGLSSISNIDFAKFRFFFAERAEGKEEVLLAIFYPHILNMYDMRDRNLFQTSRYREIWNLLLDAVYPSSEAGESDKRRGQENFYNDLLRREHTLIVMANWLYALSCAVTYLPKETTFSDSVSPFSEPSVVEDDMILLLGPDLGKTVAAMANEILSDRIVEPLLERASCEVPGPKIPEHHIGKYTASQTGIVQSSGDVVTALTRLFEAINSIRRTSIQDGSISYEGEPLMTLRYIAGGLKFKFDSGEIERYLHEWLDTGIDLGLIVPKYVPTNFDFKSRSWSRQFAPSHFYTVTQ